MRAVFFLCISACAIVVGQDINTMQNMPTYDARYDYLDVDAILDSKRLVTNYVNCLINEKPCTPEGKALKRLLPEALRTKCVRCSERQKRTAVKVIRRLKNEYPDEWAKVASRWDPTGDFSRYFEEYTGRDQTNTIFNTGNEVPASSPPPPLPLNVPLRTTAPVAPAQPTSPQVPIARSTSAPPIILNRFGDDGVLIVSSSSPSNTASTVTPRSSNTIRSVIQTRATPATWAGAASDIIPTQVPVRPANEIPPSYSTAMTIIDEIGHKIIRTTELVSDILRNTVRAVVG
uniref:Chemosensory protein 12 n=1 Tax=Streltzoviella insularis TaxID=1206366 RepID=A0A7D5YL55_9NEOP|nr:chemosensory protein 12 [Streltzoviella insularis]